MKKNIFLSLLLTFVMLISSVSVSASAYEDNQNNVFVEYLNDGSYIITNTVKITNNSRAYTKQGYRTATYYNSNDVVQWTYTLNATFSYNPGVSSTCTSVSDSYSISNDNWYIDSHSCWKSGNTAYGTVTMKHKLLGVTTQTVTRDISLSCDSYGNLS